MTPAIKAPKKLIEVALPLEAINIESLRRKQKAPKGWPTSFHKWWAQRPLAAARAILFAQLVNDPSWKWELDHPGEIPPSNLKASWAASRKRLFSLMEQLILWDNSSNAELLGKATAEIRKSWAETCQINQEHPRAAELFNESELPLVADPFAGSGTIPLEAQRLGLRTLASDLNPVSVIINKSLIEIPRRFADHRPINPASRDRGDSWSQQWRGAQGLADDVRYYAKSMRERAERQIGGLYPSIIIGKEIAAARPDLKALVGQKLTAIAWIWARTVKSPNPAFRDVDVPLVASFVLSTKEGKEAYVEPVLEGNSYRFTVKVGRPPSEASKGTAAGKRAAFRCLMSGTPVDYDHIRSEGKAGRMGARLMAIVAEGPRGRVYLPPLREHELASAQAEPESKPEVTLPDNPRDFKPPNYGFRTFGDLFTPRQLVALTTFSDQISELAQVIRRDAISAGMSDDDVGLDAGGSRARAYSEAVATYLACVLDRMVYYGSSLTTWLPKDNALRDCMPRQALAMTWDFAECNPFGKSSGDILTCASSIANYLDVATPNGPANAKQQDAQKFSAENGAAIISTDPPYYDNIAYAELSDYFYVWMRRSLRSIFPSLFATVSTPKADELVATPYRHGGKEPAEAFFLAGMTEVMKRLSTVSHPGFPVTIYYAYKQTESEDDAGVSSTGWETFLEAVIRAGFAISGTLPLRTEGAGRMMAKGNNALASSIVLVCRPRLMAAGTTSRRAFIRELNQVLPEALDEMTRGAGDDRSPVAPVDLSQAIIGPGMAVFSKYTAVLEADGEPMNVQAALQLINRFLAEDDFDHDTQFCLRWFEQYGWKQGKFGDADVLARAKGTSVDGVKQSGVLYAAGGVVRLLKWGEYPEKWNPANDERLPIWEALHHLIRVFKTEGESGAGSVIATIVAKAEPTRQLAYRLYTLCERAGWAEDARAYNEIITSWSAIETAAAAVPSAQQAELFE
ncbi:DUF1156 domain-containing protein [Bradyrhizobium japonicum]|uniref:DUF1156 domain-containing protein n=1 Tax=Bradyrhizobium japonicum TaxID=375 RepID=UPI0027145E0F|nr:DUF1156 domain-containing protein [Bradyrhizobium japonicum]WLB66004.1 DUF1156 domain-containing protein [Bradyrhizobium japonicum]